MKSLRLVLLALALAACSKGMEASNEPTSATAHSNKQEESAARAELPLDACTRDGYWTFFEAFVRSRDIREKHTAASLREAVEHFRIALVDDRWYYAIPDKTPANEQLELTEERDGDTFKVDYVRATFDSDGELVSTYGQPGSYMFEFVNGCWQLVGAVSD